MFIDKYRICGAPFLGKGPGKDSWCHGASQLATLEI